MNEFDEATRRIRRSLYVVVAISGVTSVLMLTLPFYMMQVFTRVLPSRSVESLLVLSALAAAAFVALALFDAVRQAILARIGALYESLLSGPIVYTHFLDGSRNASTGSELVGDLRTVRMFLGSRAPAAIAEAPFIPLFLIVLFVIHPMIGLLTLAGMALMIVLAMAQQSVTKAGIADQTAATRASGRLLQSHIQQAETVRVLGLQKTAIDRWGSDSARSLSSYVSMQTTTGLFGGVSKGIRFGLQAAILGLGAFLAIGEQVSSIAVFAAMMIGGRALAPLDGLVGSWSSLMSAIAAHRRVKTAVEEFDVAADPTLLPEPKGELRIEKLVYRPPGTQEPVIKGIGFGVLPGASVGIVGASGAGKSTLLRLMAGAIAPTSGAVRLDGADLRNWNRVQLGRHVGYVPQSVEFLPGTVGENIARFDPDRSDEDIVTAAGNAGVHEIILRFPLGYDTPLAGGAFSPSGGQKQLLALARALYRDPRLLFLDEPNANLDTHGDNILSGALKAAHGRGTTIVLVTQRPVLLNSVGRVLVMRDGMIDDYGPRDAVMAKLSKGGPGAQQIAKPAAKIAAAQNDPPRTDRSVGGAASSAG